MRTPLTAQVISEDLYSTYFLDITLLENRNKSDYNPNKSDDLLFSFGDHLVADLFLKIIGLNSKIWNISRKKGSIYVAKRAPRGSCLTFLTLNSPLRWTTGFKLLICYCFYDVILTLLNGRKKCKISDPSEIF